MSSWCWSKELVLPFLQFLLLPRCPLLAHVSQVRGEGHFFTKSRYKGFGHDFPLFMTSATTSKRCIDYSFCQCQAADLKHVILALRWRWWWRSYSWSRCLQPKGCVWTSCQHSQENVLLEFPLRGFKQTHSMGMVYWLTQLLDGTFLFRPWWRHPLAADSTLCLPEERRKPSCRVTSMKALRWGCVSRVLAPLVGGKHSSWCSHLLPSGLTSFWEADPISIQWLQITHKKFLSPFFVLRENHPRFKKLSICVLDIKSSCRVNYFSARISLHYPSQTTRAGRASCRKIQQGLTFSVPGRLQRRTSHSMPEGAPLCPGGPYPAAQRCSSPPASRCNTMNKNWNL